MTVGNATNPGTATSATPNTFANYGTVPSTFISDSITSTQVIALYPPTSNGGRMVNSTDMGLMTCDSVRWNLSGTPPIPNGASILGYNKNLYTVFPVVADINASGTAAPASRLYSGYGPFNNVPALSAYSTASNGQLQLQYPPGKAGRGIASGT